MSELEKREILDKKGELAWEVRQLEQLWGGEFGDAYTERNRAFGEGRARFWQSILDEFPVHHVLEVGCNTGWNLRWISERVPPEGVYGVDINRKALQDLRRDQPNINVACSGARDLPFRDSCFDLVFTIAVLIHQPPEILPHVVAEIVRCTNRFVLFAEYFSPVPTEVPYRGHTRVLFKRDFGNLCQELFPALQLRKRIFLSNRSEGWDDMTCWVFEKSLR